MTDPFALKMCDIQGRLFELAGEKNVPSEWFIRSVMAGDVGKNLDSDYNPMQWRGEEYLLEEVLSDQKREGADKREVYPREVLYWTGYLYRYWHYLTGESSSKIFRLAPPRTMKQNYVMFHTMDQALAIENLKELRRQTA
ncbi:MAG: hypothetical protein IJU49_03695 [Lachnospiraceae bacterium]|nr:hypothetical protein [Lachnospiraceae bacterium]